jgi:hypothetical protein
MTSASPTLSLNGSRLVRLLSEMEVSNERVSHQRFSERLGQLIDMPGSIRLAGIHSKLSTTVFEPAANAADSLAGAATKAEYFRVRQAMIQTIVQSFTVDRSTARNTLPAFNHEDNREGRDGSDGRDGCEGPADKIPAFGPYQRFYVTHQREFEFRILALHAEVRQAIAGISPTLAKLAVLDQALNDLLLSHSRKFLARIPRLLAKRFTYLYNDASLPPGGWFAAFCQEMQALLLAELEMRLLPTQGLIEAIDEHTIKKRQHVQPPRP